MSPLLLLKRWMKFDSEVVARASEPEVKNTPVSPEDFSGGTGSGNVGLRDACLSGWFNGDTGELFEGFPITSDDVVVDVGCGDAAGTHFCARQGASLIVADIDAEKISVARSRLQNSPAKSVECFVTDANPLPIADNVATKVISTEVLEHVDDVRRFMSELVRVGKPGALYFLTVPDQVAEGLLTKLAPNSYFQKPNHVRIIDRDEFAKIVTDAGLVIEKRASYGFYWALWWTMFWSCDVDFDNPKHPALENWAKSWGALLKTPDGPKVKAVLDEFWPKSQVIIARKP